MVDMRSQYAEGSTGRSRTATIKASSVRNLLGDRHQYMAPTELTASNPPREYVLMAR